MVCMGQTTYSLELHKFPKSNRINLPSQTRNWAVINTNKEAINLVRKWISYNGVKGFLIFINPCFNKIFMFLDTSQALLKAKDVFPILEFISSNIDTSYDFFMIWFGLV